MARGLKVGEKVVFLKTIGQECQRVYEIESIAKITTSSGEKVRYGIKRGGDCKLTSAEICTLEEAKKIANILEVQFKIVKEEGK